MSDQEATGATPVVCAAGVPPEDVAAWVLDGEESDVIALVRHVPDCAACRAVVAESSASRGVAETLRSAPSPTAPARVAQRAVGRIRTEATLLTIVRALGGGWLRVVQAFTDYATPADRPHPGPNDGLPDTGELPQLDGAGELPPS
ncbi:MAG: hypothetical protein KY469_18355 [Actinobacteria bacterium]|nr:hypothetical protein [Actinomycetota bacterium]